MHQKRSLLPGSAVGHKFDPHSRETIPNKAGAGLLPDGYNLFVGRMLYYLGIAGNLLEIITSTKAILISFLDNPGNYDPGFWIKLGISLFFSLCIQTGMWVLVVNLNDSWINIFEGQFEKAFVSQGEVSRNYILLYLFEIGGVAINIWWDIVFFNSLTISPYLISLGTALLILASILFCPMGLKLIRNAKRRIRQAKRIAAQMLQQATGGTMVVEVSNPPAPASSERGLIRYEPR